jgi:Tol biopolymer transport system component
MSTRSGRVLALKGTLFLGILTMLGMIAVTGVLPVDRARGAASVAEPRVTSITQITRDGFRKTNLLADDSQLFVTELPGTERVIAKVSLSDASRPNADRTISGRTISDGTISDRSVVASPFSNLQALDLSPDHTRLLVAPIQSGSKDDEFWTLPVAKGSPERIGDLSGRDAVWSSDGQHLVFSKGSVIYLAGAKGTSVHELYTASGSVFALRFSPDGKIIRFTVSDVAQNTTQLWEIGQNGSNPHALLAKWEHASTACCGSWTSDGRYYVFQASQTVPHTLTLFTSLWALPGSATGTDGGGKFSGIPAVVQLTNGPMSFGNASLARDSKRMWAIGVQPVAEVVKYERESKKFVPVLAGVSATDLSFSPDGKWVTYVLVPEATLWRSRPDGSDRLQLTAAPGRVALPVWSPDGKQIAFVSMQPGESWKLFLIPVGGGTAQAVVAENGSQIDANWSADGRRLMFGDFRNDVGGLSIRVLDFKTQHIETIPGSQGLFSPRWSPDGRYIAAISPDNTTLKLFDFQTQKWTNWLAETAGTVSYPIWSADSQYIYFDDLVSGEESVRRIKVGENQPELACVLGAVDRFPGGLGPWIGRAPDGSWMLVRDRSTQEVYQLSLELP